MKITQCKMIAGIVAGLVLTAGGFGVLSAQSQSQDGAQHRMFAKGERPDGQMPQMDASEAAKHIAETFGVDESQVKNAIENKKDFRDIGQAAMIAKVSGKSFDEVMALKTDDKNWRDIGESLGVTREKVEEVRQSMTAQHLSQDGDIDESKALSLLKKGYEPRDIECAAALAKASGKDIQSVLDRKKINNRWGDVAKELGVDANVLPKKFHGYGPHGHGPQGGPEGGPEGGMMGGPMMDAPEDGSSASN
ncbi:Tat pathway signal sequence domain protein [uncultured Mitsuokella sp.]|uniref:Tat pathway signal sequence domain protein n=1 Tax=uncultured Mitsuokella sp. TaxID=453120 RepID=UPI002670527A|nr:Tat pathway signal sequence domain protein [uncultured Mitsuokella sp.]